ERQRCTEALFFVRDDHDSVTLSSRLVEREYLQRPRSGEEKRHLRKVALERFPRLTNARHVRARDERRQLQRLLVAMGPPPLGAAHRTLGGGAESVAHLGCG